MRRMLLVCLFFVATVVMAGPAFAAPGSNGDKCVKDKRGNMACTFGGSEIPGVLQTPEGGIISADQGWTFGSLIDYRLSFVPELNKTVEDL